MTEARKGVGPWARPANQFYISSGGDQWCVSRLIARAQELEPFNVQLRGFNLCSGTVMGHDLLTVAKHVKQIMDADLDKPIILDSRGAVMDGRHRIVKALVLGHETIKAVQFPDGAEPASCGKESE